MRTHHALIALVLAGSTFMAAVHAIFSFLVEYGIGITLQGHCNFRSSSRDITQVRCTINGNLRTYQTSALPTFKNRHNEADPLENTLLNLKLALETRRWFFNFLVRPLLCIILTLCLRAIL